MNRNLLRPILINMILVIGLLLAELLFNRNNNTQFFVSGTAILFIAAVNFIIGMIRNRNRTGDGQYYFLFAGVLLLIGFSVCSVLVR